MIHNEYLEFNNNQNNLCNNTNNMINSSNLATALDSPNKPNLTIEQRSKPVLRFSDNLNFNGSCSPKNPLHSPDANCTPLNRLEQPCRPTGLSALTKSPLESMGREMNRILKNFSNASKRGELFKGSFPQMNDLTISTIHPGAKHRKSRKLRHKTTMTDSLKLPQKGSCGKCEKQKILGTDLENQGLLAENMDPRFWQNLGEGLPKENQFFKNDLRSKIRNPNLVLKDLDICESAVNNPLSKYTHLTTEAQPSLPIILKLFETKSFKFFNQSTTQNLVEFKRILYNREFNMTHRSTMTLPCIPKETSTQIRPSGQSKEEFLDCYEVPVENAMFRKLESRVKRLGKKNSNLERQLRNRNKDYLYALKEIEKIKSVG